MNWQLVLGVLGLIATLFFCRPSPTLQAPVTAAPPAAPVVSTPLTTEFAAGRVSVQGVVTDEAMRARVLEQAKASYGATNVIDRLTLDAKAGAPRTVVLTGEVASDAIKQRIAEAARKQYAADVTIDNRLTVAALPAQKRKLDELLAGKTIEFATASAVITEVGRKLLDQVLPILQEDKETKVEISGHTDNLGDPTFNEQLSAARADATLKYLVAKGVRAERLSAKGYGPAKPIADNATAEGQQKNRRIEFHVQEAK